MEKFLRSIRDALPEKPKALLFVSAHWEVGEFTVGDNAAPSLIYDYSGFPEHTYQLKYPAPGATDVGQRAYELLQQAGIKTARDSQRGYDHGVFIPGLVMFPDADIPIATLSLKKGLSPQVHINAGRAIAALRNEGVLIIGSGMSFHNLRGFHPSFTESSRQFDEWLTQSMLMTGDARAARLAAWESAPEARRCHPREEHLLPLMVVAGSAWENPARQVYSEQVMHGWISAFSLG